VMNNGVGDVGPGDARVSVYWKWRFV